MSGRLKLLDQWILFQVGVRVYIECGLSVSLSVNIYVYVVCQIWLVMCTICMYMSISSATVVLS